MSKIELPTKTRLSSNTLKMLVVCLLLNTLLAGCVNTVTPTPEFVQPTGTGWTVKCTNEDVAASINQVSPLDWMTLNQQHTLISGGYVWTGYDGEAKLTKSGCTIYTFYKSGISVTEGTVVADCAGGDWGVDCHASSTITVSNCTVSVVTPAGNVVLSSTWVTIAFVEEYQLLMVIAHEHGGMVIPRMTVGAPNPEPERQFFVGEGTFAYTLPAEYIDRVAGILDINKYPPYTNISIAELASVAMPLQLAPRLQAVNERLIEFNVPNQIPPNVLNLQEIVVYGNGPDLLNPSVQDVLRLGVDWNKLGSEAFPGREVRMVSQLGDSNEFTPLTTFESGMNLETYHIPQLALTVILNSDLPEISKFQGSLPSQLEAIGFRAEILLSDTIQGNALYLNNLAAGINTLFITNR